jgi:hypothetical protein
VNATQEASKRQAQQNQQVAEVVKAETEARHEATKLQRDVAARTAETDRQRDHLEAERQKIAGERREVAAQWRRDSALVPAMEALGPVLVIIGVLAFCGYLLFALRQEKDHDQAVSELLIEDLTSQQPILVPPVPAPVVAITHHSAPAIGQSPEEPSEAAAHQLIK